MKRWVCFASLEPCQRNGHGYEPRGQLAAMWNLAEPCNLFIRYGSASRALCSNDAISVPFLTLSVSRKMLRTRRSQPSREMRQVQR